MDEDKSTSSDNEEEIQHKRKYVKNLNNPRWKRKEINSRSASISSRSKSTHSGSTTQTETEPESEVSRPEQSIKLQIKEYKTKLKKNIQNRQKIISDIQMENKQKEKNKRIKRIRTNKKNYLKNLKIKKISHKKSTIEGDNNTSSSQKKHKESNCKYNLRSKKKEPDKILRKY